MEKTTMGFSPIEAPRITPTMGKEEDSVDAPSVRQAISQIRAATLKGQSAANSKAQLISLQKQTMDTPNPNERCGVCNRSLEAGEMFVGVNLADYGCNVNTDKVCTDCMDRIVKGIS